MRKGKHSGRERNGTYPIKDVFAVIEVDQADDRRTIAFNGMHVLSALSQYKVFKEKGTKCVCGLEAKYFAVERTPGPGHSIYNSWHFNLYGVNSRGREVMFTKDHIIASSVGGSDDIENYQPMCMVCNTRKGSIPMEQFKVELYEKYKEDHQYKAHVLEFMNAYYSIKLDDASYFEFMDTSHESELLHQISSVAEVRRINFRQKDIFYIYSSKFKTVHTILDPLKVEEHLRVIPNWGVGHTVRMLRDI